MDELLFFVLNLIAEALGLKKKRVALPPVQTAPPGPPRPAPAMPARGPLASAPLASANAPRTIARPAGDDGQAVTQQATAADFDARMSELATQSASAYATRSTAPMPSAGRAARQGSAPPPPAPQARPLASLFSSSDDLVRAFVMQEILQPPRSLRPKPPVSPAQSQRRPSP